MSERVEVTVGGQVYAQSLGNRVDVLDAPGYRPQSPECPVQWWAEEAGRADLRKTNESPICREARGIKPETRKVSWWGWVKWWFGR